MESHTVSGGDGVALNAVSVGSGRPIVFLHGYSQSLLSWREQFDSRLTDSFRLVAVDLRGHGDSAAPRDAYDDPALWAADVEAVLEEFDADDAVLVGWSYGGLVALDYLSHYGTDRIAGLALVGAIVSIGIDASAERLQPGYLDLVPGFQSDDVDECVETLEAFVDLCVEGALPPGDRYTALGYNVAVPPHVRSALLRRTVDHESDLADVDVPTLLIHGEADAVIDPEATETYRERLPDPLFKRYPDTGHSPFLERPGRFNADLEAFAERL